MNPDYFLVENLASRFKEILPDSIVSHTLYNDDNLKVVLFGFAPNQELSEHTAASPAILHILDGDAKIKLAEDMIEAGRGFWVYMPPNLPHSIFAKTELFMLLYLYTHNNH